MEQSQCTWINCDKPATHPQTSSDGEVWANLCDEHHLKLDATVGVDAKKCLSYWVSAQGGAKAAAARMGKEMMGRR